MKSLLLLIVTSLVSPTWGTDARLGYLKQQKQVLHKQIESLKQETQVKVDTTPEQVPTISEHQDLKLDDLHKQVLTLYLLMGELKISENPDLNSKSLSAATWYALPDVFKKFLEPGMKVAVLGGHSQSGLGQYKEDFFSYQ